MFSGVSVNISVSKKYIVKNRFYLTFWAGCVKMQNIYRSLRFISLKFNKIIKTFFCRTSDFRNPSNRSYVFGRRGRSTCVSGRGRSSTRCPMATPRSRHRHRESEDHSGQGTPHRQRPPLRRGRLRLRGLQLGLNFTNPFLIDHSKKLDSFTKSMIYVRW